MYVLRRDPIARSSSSSSTACARLCLPPLHPSRPSELQVNIWPLQIVVKQPLRKFSRKIKHSCCTAAVVYTHGSLMSNVHRRDYRKITDTEGEPSNSSSAILMSHSTWGIHAQIKVITQQFWINYPLLQSISRWNRTAVINLTVCWWKLLQLLLYTPGGWCMLFFLQKHW